MDDPWSSVENMLHWQISLARKSVSENQNRLAEVGEIYPLGKDTRSGNPHGRPDQWAFGNLTQHQVSLAAALGGLQEAGNKIDKAEAALSEGQLQDSIYWIVAANQSINSALVGWHSGGATAMWRYVGKNRKAQAVKAGKNRTTVEGDGGKFSMVELARELANKTDYLGDYLPPKQLWVELIGRLEGEGVGLEEKTDENDGLLLEYTSWDTGKRKSYKYTSFKTTISKARKKELI